MSLKNLLVITGALLLTACQPEQKEDVLEEVRHKPTTKRTISLNSEQETDWELYFGVQDESAPGSPAELDRSGL